jgi:hypothetical protein
MRQTSDGTLAQRKHDNRRLAAPGPAASTYQRDKDLAGLLKLWPHEVERLGPGDQEAIVKRILGALRSERQRGRAGHRTYDLIRHKRLIEAYQAEEAALRQLAACRLRRPANGGRAEPLQQAPGAPPAGALAITAT